MSDCHEVLLRPIYTTEIILAIYTDNKQFTSVSEKVGYGPSFEICM